MHFSGSARAVLLVHRPGSRLLDPRQCVAKIAWLSFSLALLLPTEISNPRELARNTEIDTTHLKHTRP